MQRDAHIVGRDRELAVVREFLGADSSSQALVLTGGPGIGKTTLWEAAIGAARERRLHVVAARPASTEIQLSFAALGDLLDGVGPEALAAVPGPQLRALDVALLRAEPTGAAAEPRAVAAGFLSALRALAAREPVLVAIDDVQWLDSRSADVLAFAARRLGHDGVRFLLARRSSSFAQALEQALAPGGLQHLELAPLSVGATRRLLSERLGLTLPRRVLRRVVESAQGNPLFALELGQTLLERGLPEIGEPLIVPEAVEDLVGARVERLPAAVRRLVLAGALSADLRWSQLTAIAEPDTIQEAFDAGLLSVEDDRVRLSHPLLGAAVRTRSGAGEQRELHLALARAVGDEQLRARHLALATERPDAELAATVAAAAAGAAVRGAVENAVELAGHALRLTPPARPERTGRLLALAEYLDVAGEDQRVTDLLAPEVDSLPGGAARARAHLLLADGGHVSHVDDSERHFDGALAASEGDPVLRAHALALKSVSTSVGRVERIADAEAWALEARRSAEGAGPEVERVALYALAWARIMRGRPIDDLHERHLEISGIATPLERSVERVAAVRLGWRGEAGEARSRLTSLMARADERGEGWSYLMLRQHLCELELRTGAWDVAAHLLDEWEQSAEGEHLAPAFDRCHALLAAGRGRPEEAERWAADAIADAAATGMSWDRLEALRASGVAALLAHEPRLAVERLRPVWAQTQRAGVDEPAAIPVAPELVEALAELGERDAALAVTARLADLAERQQHPWGLATATRCRALVQLSSRPDEEAASALQEAAAAYERLGLRFDGARSQLILGRAHRRLKQWGAARRSLEQAAAAFDELDSPGWAEQARSELGRVGARRPRPSGELTPAQRRVVELAAEGRSNKEIAQELFVTVHTVEAHLSHAYAKLGVRSRSQLAGRLSAQA